MRAGKENNLPVLMTVNEEGKFKKEVKNWAGMFVKDADEKVKKMDQALSKLLFKRANIQNPFLAKRKKGKGKRPERSRRERKYGSKWKQQY